MKEEKVVQNVITAINDCLAIGKFKFVKIEKKLGMIAAWGSLVKDLVGMFAPSRPDPVMQKLAELQRKIGQLSDKMSWDFNSLKAFIVKNGFYADIAQTALTLTKFMQDTIDNPCDESHDIFRDYANKNPPLQYAYKMLSLLEQESTNPLKKAMEADKLRSKETFNKWEGIIDSVISQFLFLETFINGLFWNANMYGPNQLKSKIEKLKRDIEQWRQGYKDASWGIVEKLVHDTQDYNTHVGNDEKAIMLRDDLAKVLTDDAFYIIVYNDCSGYEKHAFYGTKNQKFVSFRRGKCNIVIYRSRCFNKASKNKKEDIERDVEFCRDNTKQAREYAHDDIPKWLMDSRIRNCGFVGVIRDDQDVKIRSANCPGYGWGPGWWITTRLLGSYNYKIIAGYD